MSKLLDEAKENRDKALSEAKRSHGDGERGLYSAWREAVEKWSEANDSFSCTWMLQ